MKNFYVMLLTAFFLIISAPTFASDVNPSGGILQRTIGTIQGTDFASLNGVVNYVAASNATLVITQPLIVTASVIVPSNLQLIFQSGGRLVISVDAVGTPAVTINSSISAPMLTIFSGITVVLNSTYNPVTYSAWGTFTASGTVPQNKNLIVSYGTTTITSGSAIVTFAVGSTYNQSTNYVGFTSSLGTNGTTTSTLVQTSGTSMKIYSNGADGVRVNWFTQGN